MRHRSNGVALFGLFGLLMLCVCVTLAGQDHRQDERSLHAAMQRLSYSSIATAQYDYIMSGKIRLLLFWAGADDVGGGYIRRGFDLENPEIRLIQVLFGSDPSKAPRHLNYWGAATEAGDGHSSVLFGFMKSAKAASAADAEARIRKQNDQKQYAFEGIISQVDAQRAISRVVPLLSEVDFNLHQLERAQALVFERMTEDQPIRQLAQPDRKCDYPLGLLQATDELIGHAIRAESIPKSLCYVYNARNYTATLDDRSEPITKTIRIRRKDGTKIERTYHGLIRTHFTILNHQSGERTTFELWLGTQGPLRGVPIQVVHQPNWWLQVLLNLDTVRSPLN